MDLFEKIITLYPDIDVLSEVNPSTRTIVLKNDSDGKGDYIAEWNHPTLPRPTEEELA